MSKKNKQGFLKNTNKHKKERFRLKYIPTDKTYQNKRHTTFIALDACIAIDMVKVINGTAPIKNSPKYYYALKKLLDRSVFGKNHRYNKKGDVVFCLLPHVKKELSNSDGEIFESMKKFVENQMIDLTVDVSYQINFSKKVDRLSSQYCDLGYFIGKDFSPTVDSLIVAEASFFNLTLLSRDKHICTDFHDKNPERKIFDIRRINRKSLCNCFDGPQAEPRRVESLLKMLDYGNPPKIMNEDYLLSETQKVIWLINTNSYPSYAKLTGGVQKG